eukprot:5528370-Amphidinium_carterae.1
MKFDTWRYILCIGRELHSTTLFVPVRAPEDDAGEILRLLLTANAQLSYMESTIRAHFVPDSTERSVERTSKTVVSSVGATLQVSKALRTEAGFQTSKYQPPTAGFQPSRSARSLRCRIGPRPRPLARALSQTSGPLQGAGIVFPLPSTDRIEIRGNLRISSRSSIRHELKGTGTSKVGSFPKSFPGADANIVHVGGRHAPYFSPIEDHAVE